jgi:hypothetical protein
VIKSTLGCADERPTTTEVEIEVSTIDAVRKCRGSLRFQCFSILFVYVDTKCCAVSIGSPAARLQRRVRRVDVGVTSYGIWSLFRNVIGWYCPKLRLRSLDSIRM